MHPGIDTSWPHDSYDSTCNNQKGAQISDHLETEAQDWYHQDYEQQDYDYHSYEHEYNHFSLTNL